MDRSEPRAERTDASRSTGGAAGGRADETRTTDERRASAPDALDLLVVGTFAGGGIHRYIEEQVDRLRDVVSVRTHDMASPPIDDGWTRVVRGVATGGAAMARYPFREPPDVAHVHTSHWYSFYRAAPYVLFTRRVWDVPVVLHVHGSSFDEFVRTDSAAVAALQRRVFDASDEILVLSEYWRDVLSERADRDRIRVLPNAVDPSTFPVEADGDGTADGSLGEQFAGDGAVPHVVFVSNLIERKGVRELAAAVERLADARPGEFRVSIAGDGPESDRVERLAHERDEVTYLGYVSERRKRSLLADGSVFVLPTYAEGLPIAILEAMGAGNAVVSTTVGSIPEVIGDERGILVPPGDVDALADALNSLVTSPDRRARMAANCRRTAEREYSWERVRAELTEIYAAHA